jgi:CheY-like chemotaxis protein
MSEETHATLPQVLLVDDEKEVADAYALRLEDVANVTIAYSGEEALSTIERSSPPDVVLLDRHMPGLSGDEVLEELRTRDLHTRIVMVTAVDPRLEILDMPFDDYLCKPVEREDVRTAVDQQCQVLGYALLGEYFQLESRRTVIEAELPPERLADHDEFAELDRRADALRDRIRRLLPEADDLLEAFSAVDRTGYR